MLFAQTSNEREVNLQLGHSANEGTRHRHYRAVKMLDRSVVTNAAAEKFLPSLLPEYASVSSSTKNTA